MPEILKHKYQLEEKARTVDNIWVNEELVRFASEEIFKGYSNPFLLAETCLFYSFELSEKIVNIKKENQPIERLILIQEARDCASLVTNDIMSKKYKSLWFLRQELGRQNQSRLFGWGN